MLKHPTLIVMLISKTFSSFFNLFLPFSLVETLREHFQQGLQPETSKNEKMGIPKQPINHPWTL
jgi:flagellar motor switch protein FliM